MSQNLEIVKFFIAKFYKNNSAGMINLSSPTFSFTQNWGARQSLDQFVSRMRFLNHSAEFEIFEPVSEDDIHFYSEFEVRIPDENLCCIKGLGRTTFVVKDQLLQAIDISYHKTKQEYDEFQRLMNQSRVAFV